MTVNTRSMFSWIVTAVFRVLVWILKMALSVFGLSVSFGKSETAA